jgi:hypothetical protein
MALLKFRVLPDAPSPHEDLILATLDVSVGGALCASNRHLPEDTSLHLELMLVGGGLGAGLPIDLDARVLRCRETPGPDPSRAWEAALQFVRIAPADRKRLQNYLNSL